jgi:hypothetical protein
LDLVEAEEGPGTSVLIDAPTTLLFLAGIVPVLSQFHDVIFFIEGWAWYCCGSEGGLRGTLEIGGAPANTQSFVATANSNYRKGSSYYITAAVNLGYACHFIEDVGNSMHTGREWDQYWNQWVHSNYETYVGNRWFSSNFDYVVSNNNNYYYTNWNQGTKDLAGYTNGYLDTIYTKVYNKGPNWNLAQDTSIDAVTQNVILKTTKYTNDLALYARIG